MFEILIGPICSGKSTYSRRRAAEGAIIVNDDAIVSAVHGGRYDLYNKKLKPLYKGVESTIILSAMSLGCDVIIDRPNNKRTTRSRYIGMANAFDLPVIGMVFPRLDPVVHARRRFESDPRGLPIDHWIETAQRHQQDYEDPSFTEGFDSLIPAEVVAEMLLAGGF